MANTEPLLTENQELLLSLKQADNFYMNGEKGAAYGALRTRTQELEFVLWSILRDLPKKRDWLDPDLERQAKDLIGFDNF